MSGNKITSFIIVALLHVVVGYALISGLAYEGAARLIKKVTTVDIKKDEPKKKVEPPPKPKAAPPPIVAPPPRINVNVTPPPVTTVVTPPPAAPVTPIIAPPAPVVAPQAPPPPRIQPKGAQPRGNPGSWATSNDYPSRALREDREGTTGFRVTVGPDGRVTSCSVTSSSGSPDLDETACSLITRRARFTPATDGEGQPTTGSYSNRVRWQIPKD
jgi:protein TonB